MGLVKCIEAGMLKFWGHFLYPNSLHLSQERSLVSKHAEVLRCLWAGSQTTTELGSPLSPKSQQKNLCIFWTMPGSGAWGICPIISLEMGWIPSR